MPQASLVTSNSLGSTPVLVVRGRCTLVAIRAINTTVAAAYVQLFDAGGASSVVAGTTVPDWVIRSDPSDPSLGDGLPEDGLVFTNGVVAVSTTTVTGSTGATQHLRLGVI